jgi:hypothetical protein
VPSLPPPEQLANRFLFKIALMRSPPFLVLPLLSNFRHQCIDTAFLNPAFTQAMEKGEVGTLSIWFTTVCFRPASAFRDKVVAYEGKKGGSMHMDLPAALRPAYYRAPDRLPAARRGYRETSRRP